jgi:hypothetical protein
MQLSYVQSPMSKCAMSHRGQYATDGLAATQRASARESCVMGTTAREVTGSCCMSHSRHALHFACALSISHMKSPMRASSYFKACQSPSRTLYKFQIIAATADLNSHPRG